MLKFMISLMFLVFFLLCRRCCRALRQRCRRRPTLLRASWYPRPLCPQATWPWALAAAHPPCQVGTAGQVVGTWRFGGFGTPTFGFFPHRWSLVPARDHGDVAGPGARPSHHPWGPADPQCPGEDFPSRGLAPNLHCREQNRPISP